MSQFQDLLLANGARTKYTFVETGITLLLDDAVQGLGHALLLLTVAGNVHLALDGDVWVRHRRGKELAQGAEEEGDSRSHLSPLLDVVLHLLEERVLKNGVDNQDQRGQDTGEKALRTLVLEEGHEGANRGWRLSGLASLEVSLGVVLARGDTSVHNPDGVGDDDSGRTGDGAGDHGLNCRELLVGASGRGGGLLEEGTGPLIPVVVDEVGNADSKERRVNASVQAGNAFAGDNLLDSFGKLCLRLLGLDLSACRQGDQRIPRGRPCKLSVAQ